MSICRTPDLVSTQSIFSYVQIFFPNFAFFTVKLPSVTQRPVSQDNAFKKPVAFFREAIGLNNSFTLIENNFRFLR